MMHLVFALVLALPDGEGDNRPENVRPIPPPGIAVAEADRAEIEAGLAELGAAIEALRAKASPDLLADVAIYHKAVRYALEHQEFFDAKEIPIAKEQLRAGLERAAALAGGAAPWSAATGLVPRGYYSKIDGSAQPYGLVVPASYSPKTPHRFRLDAWFHGRGETLSELNFIAQRTRSAGEFVPPNAFVLHLYGRYCNANKFAGEIDLFEALESVQRQYPIDENRIVVRGFSMGGAACWQFAVHYADRWCAAAPGAGFSETPEFLRVFQNEKIQPAEWEQTLWHLYDSTDYAANLFNLPLVAYSGEADRQKQAADAMAKAMQAEGLDLVHIIGPKTGHRYEPSAKLEIDRRIDAIAARGRDPLPRKVRLTTWTLRYNSMFWVRADALERHWQRTRIDAELAGEPAVKATTENVAALTLAMGPGLCPLEPGRKHRVSIDGTMLEAPPPRSDRSWEARFQKSDGVWRVAGAPEDGSLRKRHGLQGPIDDAFLDRFVFVRPSGKAASPKVEAWTRAEMERAIVHWRKQFRGDAPVVDDAALTEAEIANANLVLWGDAQSNKVLARIAASLPLAELPLSGDAQVPVLIYPNPLNPARYVVLNSGFTFREYDYLNNARQVPKLPDWAVIDVATPPGPRWPGKVVAAGFFDEGWKLRR
jgi:hypothetical protein